MTRLYKFFRLSSLDRRLLLEATIVNGLVRLALLALPFRFILRILGRLMEQTTDTVNHGHSETVERVCWAVRIAGRHAPWKSTCLIEALSAKLMLRHRGAPSTLYFGVARDENQEICYHAWLRSGAGVVVGGPMDKSYSVLAAFGEQGK
ncbi:lasso peptide biosynthesis B2 protein [Thermodesulfobacteriota bacterium]